MEEKIFIASLQEAHTIVDDAMKKGARSVSIYISPDGGMSISGQTKRRCVRPMSRERFLTTTTAPKSDWVR